MIEGISHLTFIVKDLERATVFFRSIFDAEEIYSSGDKTFSLSKEKFLIINGQWICIMDGESLSDRTYNHVAFKIRDEEYDVYESRIRALGVDFRPPRLLKNGGSKLGEIVEKEIEVVGVLTVAYVRDPEGNIIEIQNWK